jgi:acetyl esterase/lipase
MKTSFFLPARITAAASFVAAVLFLASCSSEQETPDPNLDLAYGTSSSAQVLDLFLPADSGSGSGPADTLVLYIHGGAWVTGDKGDDPIGDIRRIAAGKGYAAASMNYRLISLTADNKVDCGDMLADIDLAVRFIKARIPSIDRLILIGVSAGAHLSLLYTYQHYAAGDSPVPPIPIVLCISLSGPTDFSDPAWYRAAPSDAVDAEIPENMKITIISALTGSAFTPEDYRAVTESGELDGEKQAALLGISPINFVSERVPPTIMAHGRKDGIVPFSNAERLKAALDEKAIAPAPAVDRLTVFPNSGHMLAGDPDKLAEFLGLLDEYIGNPAGVPAGSRR